MTPTQLKHFAEQAEFAAGFFAVTNPAAARRFNEAAATAVQLSATLERQQQLARLRAELADIRRRIDRRARTSGTAISSHSDDVQFLRLEQPHQVSSSSFFRPNS
jgi:hypothetical protein